MSPPPSPAREIGIEVEGGRIGGWLSGNGPRLLLLHGGPGLTDYLASLADELAPSFTVFRYQQRGLPPSVADGDRTVEGHVADAIRVLDGLGWERAIVAGHSWGGHLAMHVAVAHPERFRGLAPIDALWAVGDGGAEEFGENLMRQLSEEERARYEEVDARESSEEATEVAEPEGLRILWPYYFGDPSTASEMPPMLSDPVGQRTAWASINEHFASRTLEMGLPGLAVPTMLIHGQLDPIPSSEAVRTAQIIPGAELRILPKVGHFPWLEQPGITRSLLEELAGRLPN
jgi:proline iminopeptidase